MSSYATAVGKIDRPKIGDTVMSTCGVIKVTVKEDGTLPITKLSNQRGSFNFQVYYEGQTEPDTVVYRTDDPPVPSYRLDSGKSLSKIRIVTNPV
jgi:hypothetical protein